MGPTNTTPWPLEPGDQGVCFLGSSYKSQSTCAQAPSRDTPATWSGPKGERGDSTHWPHQSAGRNSLEGGDISLLSLHWTLGGQPWWVLANKLRTASFLAVVMWVSWTHAVGFQNVRAVLQDGSLKRWSPRCWVQTLHSSGEAARCVFPSNCLTVLGVGLWHKCTSAFPARFNVGIFSFTQWVGVAQLVSAFLSEENCSLCSCTFGFHGNRWIREPPMSPSWTRTLLKCCNLIIPDVKNILKSKL